GDPFFQRPRGGVLATLLVAHLCRRDRRAHPGRGACLRVAVEVDRCHPTGGYAFAGRNNVSTWISTRSRSPTGWRAPAPAPRSARRRRFAPAERTCSPTWRLRARPVTCSTSTTPSPTASRTSA